MQLKYSYWYFKEVIDPDTCQKIIDLGLNSISEAKQAGVDTRAVTFGNKEKHSNPNSTPQGEKSRQQLLAEGIQDSYVRDSEVAWLNDQWIYDLLFPYIHHANKSAGWNWQWNWAESLQFTVYKPGGFYSWHKDGASDHYGAYRRYIPGISPRQNDQTPSNFVTQNNFIGKVRKISMTLNLNRPGDYEGGNLKFDFGHHADRERFHECEEIRPQGSIIVFPSFIDHCVTPLTSGTRYSLVMWALGEPFK